MARPKKPIDPVQLEKLAAMGCSIEEIAAFFDVSRDTIERRFAAVIRKGREFGKTKLRRLQWQACEKGNVTMMIWLGKQLLDQKDPSLMNNATVNVETKGTTVVYQTEWGGASEGIGSVNE